MTMKKSNILKFKCYFLVLLCCASLSCSSSSKKSSSKEIFYGNKDEVMDEYNNPNSNYLAYVADERNGKDPNMKIYMSHYINDSDSMIYILEELLKREENDPTQWDRTIESMYKEWKIHNFCYNIGFRRYSTESVDLNNDDEDDYNENNFISLILKKPHSEE